MRTIWKGVLKIDPFCVSFTQVLRMPENANLVHVAKQDGDISLWFEVDPNLPLREKKFQIFGTGTGPIGFHLTYRGTALLSNGALVLHIYEVNT